MNNYIPEQAVLACLLHDNTTYDDIAHILKPIDFYMPFHQDTFEIISLLIKEGKKADVICLAQALKNRYGEQTDDSLIKICEIAQSCYSANSIKQYADLVKQASLDRNLIKIAQDVITSVHQKKENRLDYAQQRFLELNEQISSEIFSMGEILGEVLFSIDQRQQCKNMLTGVPTGFVDLDKLTHGLHRGDLIILAGRPSMGKTLLAMNIAEHIANNEQQTVAVFSLEMSKQQLIERSLISLVRLDADKVKSGTLEAANFARLSESMPHLSTMKLFVDDRSLLSVSDIRSKCKQIKRKHGLSLIVVDYITLMAGDGENETIRIGNITRGLKLLARDLDVPVLAISQLNRSVEQRSDKRPTMADLRQSGSIEQDADLIVFIYRDEIYNRNSQYKGVAEIILTKHRNGRVGTVLLAFNGRHCRFDNCAEGSMGNSSYQSTSWQSNAYEY